METRKRNFITFLTVIVLTAAIVLFLSAGASSAGARPQEITGSNNHVITLEQAVKYVSNYSAAPAFAVKGGYFDRSIFEKILKQEDCVAIRMYYGRKDDGTPCIVLVGVDSKGADMTNGVLGDEYIPCPPLCASPSPLYK